MEENNQAKLISEMALNSLKKLEKFKKGIVSTISKLKTTGEKINFVKKEIINLKKQAINSKADYVRTWNIKYLENLLKDLESINELENSVEKEVKKETPTFIIKGKLSESGIEKYFMQLTDIHSDYPNSKKDKICVLTAPQVKTLLNPRVKKQKFATPNFSQQQLRVFIYQFKNLHKSKDNTVKDFVKFEIENFEAFAGLREEKEYTNFNKGKVRLYPPYDTF